MKTTITSVLRIHTAMSSLWEIVNTFNIVTSIDNEWTADKWPERIARAQEIDLCLSRRSFSLSLSRDSYESTRLRYISAIANIFPFQVNDRPCQLGGSSNRGYGVGKFYIITRRSIQSNRSRTRRARTLWPFLGSRAEFPPRARPFSPSPAVPSAIRLR